MRRRALILLPLAALAAAAAEDLGTLERGFAEPPAEARPLVRWWWFGPAVVKPQLEREMTLMKAGGFGGFEVQPTYPLALDGRHPGLKNLKFLSPEFLDMLGFTARKAGELGLRMDLTLGSGWPYGGPMFTRDEAAQSIREAGMAAVAPGQARASPPTPPAGLRGGPIIAALLGPADDPAPRAGGWLPLLIDRGSAELPADLRGAARVRFYARAPAGLMRVKRPAYGAEGFVVDHYSSAAVAKFIREVAEPEVGALGENPPYSVFCDSLEVDGEGWTPDLPAEFRRRRGYDLLPLLPALFNGSLPGAPEIRADYGRTVAELFNERFVDAFSAFARDHRSRFRIQAYGTPPTTLSTYARADMDEGENGSLDVFSATRWASSASHLLGRPVASAEAFTWLHSPVFMAAPMDIKAEANLHFLNGINQLLFHGWPYTAPGVGYPGWRFYAAAVFDEKNPWWIVMPDVTGYLARIGFLLRQGDPANDVALYLPEEDGFAMFTPSFLEMAGAGGQGALNRLVSACVPPILRSGHNFDYIDDGLILSRGRVEDGALSFGRARYRIVVMPNVTRIPLAVLERLEEFASRGGILIAVGRAPSMAPGFMAADSDHRAIREIGARLFLGASARGLFLPDESGLAARLKGALQPDVACAREQPGLGFVHRHAGAAEIYFLGNTSNRPVNDTPVFRVRDLQPEWWDPLTGRTAPAAVAARSGDGISVAVGLPPYGARFLVFTSRHLRPAAPAGGRGSAALDLGEDWDVSFANASGESDPAPRHYRALASWTDSPDTRYFSGVATYEKRIDVPAAMLRPGAGQRLDFGGAEATDVPDGARGFRANLQPPIGDAAVVYVNGARAGAVWCPPYSLEITGLLKPGENTIRIQVANRAVNYMADTARHPPPNYAELNADPVYGGNRFQPQDMDRIREMPSGLLKRVRLVSGSPE